jgi:PhnB protein
MPIKSLNPYLNFNGDAAEAIRFYEAALGVKADNVMRFGDMPGNDAPPAARDRVIHARLPVGSGVIMISDMPADQTIGLDGNVHINLDFDDVDDMRRKFDALAAGGKVTMALAPTFWGATFGMLTDRFGVRWMFNCETRK